MDKQQSIIKLSDFKFLRYQSHSCNGQNYTVEEYLHPATGMEFVLIPAGSFLMGKNDSADPKQPTNIESFLMSKYTVTQEIWKNVMGTEPWSEDDGDELKKDYPVKEGKDYPAVYIDWRKSVEFCEKLGLHLPRIEQWEYACRAGTDTKYYWGNEVDDDYLWYIENTECFGVDEENENGGNPYPHEVGKKKPNAFGLYDMSGNVWQWCSNYIPITPAQKLTRGGSWQAFAQYCCSCSFSMMEYYFSSACVGFRPIKLLSKAFAQYSYAIACGDLAKRYYCGLCSGYCSTKPLDRNKQ